MQSCSENPSVNGVSLSLEDLFLNKGVAIDNNSLTARNQRRIELCHGPLPAQPGADLSFGSPMPWPITPSRSQCHSHDSDVRTGHNVSNLQLPGTLSSFRPPGSTLVDGCNDYYNPYPSYSAAAIKTNRVLKQHEFRKRHAFFYAGALNDNAFIRIATSEAGSMELQDLLQFHDPGVTHQLFGKVVSSFEGVPIFIHLMMDRQGKYVFLKLIQSCNSEQLELITKKITENQLLFLYLTRDDHGSKSIRKLIRILKYSPLLSSVVSNLSDAFYLVMTDRTGSQVVSECLGRLKHKQKTSLYEAAIRYCVELATDGRGCVSLNNFIDCIQGPHRYYLLDKISANAVHLSQDPSGNYVIQKIIGLENPGFTSKICFLLRGHFLKLSLLKGGSHVVEKCLNCIELDFVVICLLDSDSSANQLLQVARDRYGNYVIQAALKAAKKMRSMFYPKLLKRLQPHLDDLRFGHGKNVFKLVVEGLSSSNPNIV